MPAAADWPDTYGSIGDLFRFYEDPNTGLTAFPVLNVPMGGRYEGMGTAFTAVASDVGFIEANPAGSALLPYTELALLHNNWIETSNVESVVYATRFGDLGVAASAKFLYVPFTGYTPWGDRESTGYYSESVATANISYNFLRSYGYSGLSVGMNLKGAYRHIPSDIAEGQSAASAMVDFGVLTRFNFLKFYPSRDRNFSVGATVKNVGLEAMGDPLPTALALGIAYRPWKMLLWSFDTTVPVSFRPDEVPAELPSFATGVSLSFTPFFDVHSGFLLRGGNPRFTLGGSVDLDPFTLTSNYTLDMTTQFSRIDRLSMEAKLNLGDGGRAETVRQVDGFYLQSLEAYAAGRLEEAASFARLALALDPTFTPALETARLAERTLELQDQMEAKQVID